MCVCVFGVWFCFASDVVYDFFMISVFVMFFFFKYHVYVCFCFSPFSHFVWASNIKSDRCHANTLFRLFSFQNPRYQKHPTVVIYLFHNTIDFSHFFSPLLELDWIWLVGRLPPSCGQFFCDATGRKMMEIYSIIWSLCWPLASR